MLEEYKKCKLLVETAAKKTPHQLIGIIDRKIRSRVIPRLPINFDQRYRDRIPVNLQYDVYPHKMDTAQVRDALSNEERERYRSLAADFADGQVTFLNRSQEIINPASVSPRDDRIVNFPRLWYLKLAGFEPVRWGVLGYDEPLKASEFVGTIESWLKACERRETVASRTGYLRGFWTPYAVSLRIITLCRYAGWTEGFSDQILRFLYKNLLFLENNVEHDVGGNHLFENGAALVIGGAAFPDDGGRFVNLGIDVLESATEAQFLADGYHYERSPMYHLAVTMRLLTSLSVLEKSEREVPSWLQGIVTRSMSYLLYLRPPDERIPLLNDSVFDEAERLNTMLQYARSVGVDFNADIGPSNISGESGLHWLSSGGIQMLVDAGDSGPASQLAHTHNDPGTVLIWRGSVRLITDTGTFDYQPGDRRQTARSVRAHNTVEIGDTEPVAFNGRFRMSEAIETTTTRLASDEVSAVSIDYCAGRDHQYTHRRTCYEGSDWILVWDKFTHDDETEIEEMSYTSRLHLHPDVSIRDDPPFQLIYQSVPQLSIQLFDIDELMIRTAPYFPRYGEEQDREVLTISFKTPSSGYLLTLDDVESTLNRTNGTPAELRVGKKCYRLPSPEEQS